MEEKDRAQKLEEAYGMALILFLTLLILLVLQYLRPVAFFLIILLMMPVFFYDWLCFTRLQREERGDPWSRKAEKTPRRRKGLPPWLWLLIAGAVIFQLVNFCISVSTLGNGKHREIDGAYFRWIQGERIEITKEEYNRLEAANSRLFTGHLMLMSVVPLIYFGGRREETEEQQ